MICRTVEILTRVLNAHVLIAGVVPALRLEVRFHLAALVGLHDYTGNEDMFLNYNVAFPRSTGYLTHHENTLLESNIIKQRSSIKFRYRSVQSASPNISSKHIFYNLNMKKSKNIL